MRKHVEIAPTVSDSPSRLDRLESAVTRLEILNLLPDAEMQEEVRQLTLQLAARRLNSSEARKKVVKGKWWYAEKQVIFDHCHDHYNGKTLDRKRCFSEVLGILRDPETLSDLGKDYPTIFQPKDDNRIKQAIEDIDNFYIQRKPIWKSRKLDWLITMVAAKGVRLIRSS